MVLKTDLINPLIKKGALAVLFYTSFLLACFLLEKVAPSGVCNPGLGFMLLLTLPFVCVILLIVQSVKLFKGKEENKLAFVVHLFALIALLVIFYIKTH